MLNEKEWKRLQGIKERSALENCAGYSGLSAEEARWLISLLEQAQAEAGIPQEEGPHGTSTSAKRSFGASLAQER